MKRANTNGWKSLDTLASDFLEAKAAKKIAETNYDSIKKTIVTKLDGQVMAETDLFVIQHTNSPRQVIDVERLKTERPELYLHYLKSQDHWELNVNGRATSTRTA